MAVKAPKKLTAHEEQVNREIAQSKLVAEPLKFISPEPDIADFTKRQVVILDGNIVDDRINNNIQNITDALSNVVDINSNYKTGL